MDSLHTSYKGHNVATCMDCGSVLQPADNIARDLFKMVYDWGRVGIVVDYHAPAFQSELKKLLCAHTKTINIGDNEHEVWACVECEHILDNNMAVL